MISLFNEKVFWIKEESYAHSGNFSSEKFIIFNFWFLFVTKNGILLFSSFGVTKWQWIKNSKWNHPKLGDCGLKKQIGYGFWPLFVTKNCILRFSIFDLIKKQRIKNSKWKSNQHIQENKAFMFWMWSNIGNQKRPKVKHYFLLQVKNGRKMKKSSR